MFARLAVQTMINYTYMYSCCVAYGLIGDELVPAELRGLSGEQLELAVISWQNKIQAKIASHRRMERAGRRRSSCLSYSRLRPHPVTGRRAALACEEEAERVEASINTEVASFLGGQWMGVDDGASLSSITSESNEDDCTWLSSVSSEESRSSSSSCSAISESLWSSCSGDDGSWLSGGEEGGEVEEERECEMDLKGEEVVAVTAVASASATSKLEAHRSTVCTAASIPTMEIHSAAAGNLKAGTTRKASPVRDGKKGVAAAGSSKESVKPRQIWTCSPAGKKAQPRSSSLPHATAGTAASARERTHKGAAAGVTGGKARAAVQAKSAAQCTAAVAPLPRSHSLPCPPCHGGGMRMVHGSRSPELLATASQAAKVAAIVKGGRGKAVSEEERARGEARRERAAAALRESHKWERERWESGAGCGRLSILRKTKSM